jgi:type III pantothenate kinase
MPALLCIDIGNTHTHLGLVADGGRVAGAADVSTPALGDPMRGLGPVLVWLAATHGPAAGAAFCSVVPEASAGLHATLAAAGFDAPVFQLTHEKKLGVPLSYPRPAEMGQDRLANAAAARALGAVPGVVIDLGTAVTFDIVTARGGYEGGIIAPGLDVMRSYLHDRTAQLPLLDDTALAAPASVVGKSTADAMRIGMTLGFAGMIQALLDATLAELAARGESPPAVIATGGCADFLAARLSPTPRVEPHLTLLGLAAAWHLNQ